LALKICGAKILINNKWRANMMLIAECLIDERGRLTLPKSFLKANGINKNTKVSMMAMYNSHDTVKLIFDTNVRLVDETEENSP
tara:strand:+ start:1577 stop:1828 length:252 start_codon:yes stop_codon:yes gene_type:complete